MIYMLVTWHVVSLLGVISTTSSRRPELGTATRSGAGVPDGVQRQSTEPRGEEPKKVRAKCPVRSDALVPSSDALAPSSKARSP